MTKTILELAKELDVTKQAIQYQIKKIDDKFINKRHDGAFLITSKGQEAIRKNMGLGDETTDKTTDKSDKQTDKSSNKDLLAETVASLQEELTEKNDQIESLHNLLSQQQQLNLQSNKQVEHLQLEVKATEKNEEEVDEEKQGFWSRLFNL